jgi:serine/threonine-protein kinase
MRTEQPDSLREQLQASLGTAYTLEGELAGGGMARLFVAREEALGRPVVVKVLPAELAEGLSADRFVREIRLAAQLQDPHIVPVLASGTTASGLPFYTMPLVRGESLRHRLRGGPIPVDDATSMLRDVAQALAYAHQRGVVHRDIKPENVLLAGGTAMVGDFGIAKALGVALTHDTERSAASTLTELGTTLGTPAYMAPEQSAGDAVDARTDIYSWGVVAYELLAGKHPFAGKSTTRELIVAHLSETPAPLSASGVDIPPPVAALVMRCLEKDPNRRPQIAEELVEALRTSGQSHRVSRGHIAALGAIAVGLGIAGTLIVRAIAPETPASTATASTGASSIAASTRFASSLAVLPLVNYSRDPAQDFFAEGMTDELTSTLSKLQALRVIAHRSMLRFRRSERSVPEIARELGVRYVVDGSVMQEGGRVRIRATLLDGVTDAQVWTESFERERRDVLALQREIALAIARAIELTLTPQDRSRLAETLPVDPLAFDLYIKGTQVRYRDLGRTAARRALDLFERAIARDPGYAPAHAGLGLMQVNVGDTAGARRSVGRARALDPSLAEGAMLLSMIRQNVDNDWAGAEAALREAIRLNPGYAEAHHELSMLLMRRGRFDEALREAQLTVYLAPGTPRFEMGVGEVLLYAGRYSEAVAAAEKTLALDSTFTAAHGLKAYVYALQGATGRARAALSECKVSDCAELSPALLGYAHAVQGNRAEALRHVALLEAQWRARGAESGAASGIAGIYAALGERDLALDWLERRVDSGENSIYVGIDPEFRTLHAEPRFRALLEKLRLPALP